MIDGSEEVFTVVDSDSFTILCVCTGNVCRSPAAERLLTSRLGRDVRVSSAGTYALVGDPVSPPMDSLLLAAGADPAGFRARRLTQGMLREVDLVLTMTQAHRGDAVELWPRAVRRTFTLKELGRLLSTIDPAALPEASVADRLRVAVPLAAGQRRQVRDSREDDIVDPYQMSAAVYAEAFEDIEAAVNAIVDVIGAGHPDPELTQQA